MLSMCKVSKNYRHATGVIQVLDDVNLEIAKGELICILGPSGSGKSTLLSLLAGLDRPSSGDISYAGTHIGSLTEQKLTDFRAKTLGIVFQQFHLLPQLTAEENVALPLMIAGNLATEQVVKSTLAQVGLAHRLKHFPRELSGGECQRVAIARAMINKPPVILADEPSGNLDNKTGHDVMDTLFSLVRDVQSTLILVTHNEALAEKCDRRLSLREGRLYEL